MKTLDKNFENEGFLGGDSHFDNTHLLYFQLLGIIIVVLVTMIPTMDMGL